MRKYICNDCYLKNSKIFTHTFHLMGDELCSYCGENRSDYTVAYDGKMIIPSLLPDDTLISIAKEEK